MSALFIFAVVALLIVIGIAGLLIVASQSENIRGRRLARLAARRPSMTPDAFVETMVIRGHDEALVLEMQRQLGWFLSEQPQFGWNPGDDADRDYDVPTENVTEIAERLFAFRHGRRPTKAEWQHWKHASGKPPLGRLENLLRFAEGKADEAHGETT